MRSTPTQWNSSTCRGAAIAVPASSNSAKIRWRMVASAGTDPHRPATPPVTQTPAASRLGAALRAELRAGLELRAAPRAELRLGRRRGRAALRAELHAGRHLRAAAGAGGHRVLAEIEVGGVVLLARLGVDLL